MIVCRHLIGLDEQNHRWFKRRFALHFVPLVLLVEQLQVVSYRDSHGSRPGGWIEYTLALNVIREQRLTVSGCRTICAADGLRSIHAALAHHW